jgi:hypothetical protein
MVDFIVQNRPNDIIVIFDLLFTQQLKSGITQDSISSIYSISVRTASIPIVSKPELHVDVGLDAADKRVRSP